MDKSEDKENDEPQKSHKISIIKMYGTLLSGVFTD